MGNWKYNSDPKRKLHRPGNPTHYLHHLEQLLRAGAVDGVILYCRVSGDPQKPNLKGQLNWSKGQIEKLGIPFLEVFEEVCPGWDLENHHGFLEAIQAAKAHGPGIVVVAESTCRFLRHPDYNQNKKSWPTVAQFKELATMADGVLLATILPPNAPYEEIRKHQSKRGQLASGNTGGRSAKMERGDYQENYKQQYAIDKLTWAYWLGIVEKKKISKLIDRSPSTVRGWVKQWEKHWNRPWPKIEK